MKRFRCGDVVTGCTATFEAPTEQELFEKIAAHASAGHGITQVSPELVEQIRLKIRDEPS